MKKRCYRCKGKKKLDEFGVNRAAPDQRSFYCRSCNRDITNERRERLRENRKSEQAIAKELRIAAQLAAKEKQQQEAVQLKLFVETQIRLLTKNGASRELIHQTTKAPWDLVCDCLADLWDKGEVKIKRRGEDRIFVLKAA